MVKIWCWLRGWRFNNLFHTHYQNHRGWLASFSTAFYSLKAYAHFAPNHRAKMNEEGEQLLSESINEDDENQPPTDQYCIQTRGYTTRNHVLLSLLFMGLAFMTIFAAFNTTNNMSVSVSYVLTFILWCVCYVNPQIC